MKKRLAAFFLLSFSCFLCLKLWKLLLLPIETSSAAPNANSMTPWSPICLRDTTLSAVNCPSRQSMLPSKKPITACRCRYPELMRLFIGIIRKFSGWTNPGFPFPLNMIPLRAASAFGDSLCRYLSLHRPISRKNPPWNRPSALFCRALPDLITIRYVTFTIRL